MYSSVMYLKQKAKKSSFVLFFITKERDDIAPSFFHIHIHTYIYIPSFTSSPGVFVFYLVVYFIYAINKLHARYSLSIQMVFFSFVNVFFSSSSPSLLLYLNLSITHPFTAHTHALF